MSATFAGDGAALPQYAARLRAIRAAYLGHRAAYYALEGRWSDEPFWRRRNNGQLRAECIPFA